MNKYYAIPFILILLFAILFGLIQTYRLEKAKKEVKQKESVIAEKNAVIEYHVNEKGQLVADKEAAVLKAKELEASYPEIYKSLKEDMDVNFKRLKAFVQNEFEARGSGTGTIVNNHYYDSGTNQSFDSLKFKMDDSYLKFNVNFELRYTPGKPINITQSPYTYTFADTAKTAIHGRKKWFLGSEKLYATTVFSNPNAKITGTTNILVDNYRDKRFSIGVSAGWGLVKVDNDIHTGWFVGPSISYSLFKF